MAWIDLHIDTLWRMRLWGVDPLRAQAPSPRDPARAQRPEEPPVPAGDGGDTDHRLHVDVHGLADADVRVAVWAVFVEPEHTGPAATEEAWTRLELGPSLVARAGGRLVLVRDRRTLAHALGGAAHGMILGLEGAHPLQGDLENFERFCALGLRVLELTWNHSNPFATGCGDAEVADPGLTKLGRRLVEAAERRGVLIDAAHGSARTIDDLAERARRPWTISHTGCGALREHRRNLSDEQLRRVAAAGGVVGVSLCPAFLVADPARAGISDVGDHLVHAAEVAGCDAVALGSDFDGIERTPADLTHVSMLPRLADHLRHRGMHPPEIEKICWRNAAGLLRSTLPAAEPETDATARGLEDGIDGTHT